jgi:hypothetical protein
MSRPPRSPPRKPSEINKKAIPRVHYPKLNTSITRKAYVYYEPELPLHIGRFVIYDHPSGLPHENIERFTVNEPLELPRTQHIGRFHITESTELPRRENIGRYHVTESNELPELPRIQNIGRFQILEPIELAGRKSKSNRSKKSKDKPNHKRTIMLKQYKRNRSNRLRK